MSYYGRFSHALPSDAGYFPIGVWFESVLSQADVDLDKDAGLNLYVVLTADSNMSLVRGNGMRAFVHVRRADAVLGHRRRDGGMGVG